MINPNEYSKRPTLKNFYKAVKLGRQEVVRVQRVDEKKGYIDLSKKDVNPTEAKECLDKFHCAKTVHSILIHIIEKANRDLPKEDWLQLPELYEHIVWPLNR